MVLSKRKLRSLQRQANASKKRNFMNKIMSASESDTEMFHKPKCNQRRNKHQNTEILVLNDKNLTDENDILNGWFEYVKGLSTPDFNDDYFDLERLMLAQKKNQTR